MSKLITILALFAVISKSVYGQDEANYSIGIGLGKTSVSQKISVLNERNERYLMEIFFIKKSGFEPIFYKIGIVNDNIFDKPLNNFYSMVYINAGFSEQWKMIKASYYLGPSYSIKGYRISKSHDPNDNLTYRKIEHAIGFNQSASIIVMPIKHFGVGVSGMINLSKSVDSKGWQIVLEYNH